MSVSQRAKRALLIGAGFLGIFTILALLMSLGSAAAGDHPIPLGPLLRQEFKACYTCALFSMAALWFCGLNRLESGQVKRWLFTHLLAVCVFSSLYAIATAWVIAGERSVMHPGQILTFSYLLRNTGMHYFIWNLLIYWVVVFGNLGWLYYQRFREREVQTAQLQRELVEARLDALRMQLNPHFLFNTLHAISALIHDQPEAADRMVARLSDLLRLSLDPSKPQEVPLTEELVFLEGYLEIEQTRFADRLQITRAIDPEARPALVPFLLLQPLVENAIRHGIEPREQAGLLAITARRNDGKLELRVRDDGPGLAAAANKNGREGIGLANTRARLTHLYGQHFSLELADLPEGGLEARITLPFHTSAKTS